MCVLCPCLHACLYEERGARKSVPLFLAIITTATTDQNKGNE
jgi:hypothetical protein